MSAVTHVLMKVLVKKFYERNAGLLALVFYIMFGVVESNQLISYHESLIYGVLSSPVFLLVVMAVWLLYTLKYLQLVFSELAQPQNQFLIQYSSLPGGIQIPAMFAALAGIYLPVLAYSFFIIWIGIGTSHLLPTISIIVFHLAVLMSTSVLIVNRLNTLHEKKTFVLLPTILWPWRKPLPLFYIGHLLNEIPLALFFAKIFSLLCLFGFLQIPLDHYENRLALLGFLFGLIGHIVIVFEFRKLEEERMIFLRGLPISTLQRYGQLALTYLIIVLPEVLFLAANHLHVIDLVLTTLVGVAFLLYQHSRLYRFEMNMDKHLTHTFGLFLVSFMIVLFKLAWVGVAVLLVMAFNYIKNNFYSHEQ